MRWWRALRRQRSATPFPATTVTLHLVRSVLRCCSRNPRIRVTLSINGYTCRWSKGALSAATLDAQKPVVPATVSITCRKRRRHMPLPRTTRNLHLVHCSLTRSLRLDSSAPPQSAPARVSVTEAVVTGTRLPASLPEVLWHGRCDWLHRCDTPRPVAQDADGRSGFTAPSAS